MELYRTIQRIIEQYMGEWDASQVLPQGQSLTNPLLQLQTRGRCEHRRDERESITGRPQSAHLCQVVGRIRARLNPERDPVYH